MQFGAIKVAFCLLAVFSSSELLAIDVVVNCQQGIDCTSQLQSEIDRLSALPLGLSTKHKITLESVGQVTSILSNSITLKSNVHIVGATGPGGTPKVTLHLVEAVDMFVTNAFVSNIALSYFKMSTESGQFIVIPNVGYTDIKLIHIKAPFSNLAFTNLQYDGDGGRTFFSSGDIGTNLTISGNRITKVRRFAWIRRPNNSGKITGIKIESNNVQDLALGAIQLSGPHENVDIHGNSFLRHMITPPIPTDNAGHMIQTEGKTEPGYLPITNLNIGAANKRNIIRGVPGLSNVKDVDGNPLVPGASGDLVAIRNVNGFTFVNNLVTDSGEVGLTISDGAINGTVIGNEFKDIDAIGILVGSGLVREVGPPVVYYAPVINITVSNNVLSRFALDHSWKIRGSTNLGPEGSRLIQNGVAVFSTGCTFDDSTNIVTSGGIRFENGSRIRFEKGANATLPTGILTTRDYFVQNLVSGTANAVFKISVSPNPTVSPIDFTGNGQGTVAVDLWPAYHALAGIRVWNALNCKLTGNTINSYPVDSRISSGIWIWSNPLNPVRNLELTGNTIFTQSVTWPSLTQSKVMQSNTATGFPIPFSGTVFAP